MGDQAPASQESMTSTADKDGGKEGEHGGSVSTLTVAWGSLHTDAAGPDPTLRRSTDMPKPSVGQAALQAQQGTRRPRAGRSMRPAAPAGGPSEWTTECGASSWHKTNLKEAGRDQTASGSDFQLYPQVRF